MFFGKTNLQFYFELKEKLFSQLKDGFPNTLIEKIVALGYPIVLIFILIVAIIGAIRFRKIWNWKIFTIVFSLCSVTGWMWGIYIQKFDPNFPGWLFLPWSVSNIEFILSFEDWLFYPFCTFLFYSFFRWIKESSFKDDNLKICVTISHILITCFFCYFSSICGISLALQCAIPAILLFFYAWDRWDVKHYLKFIFIVLLFEIIWDFIAVSWISYIHGMAWASQWVYIGFDANGNYIHSKVFIDYGKYPWAWVFKSPIEITPWFGLSVGMYFYSIVIAVDKKINGQK